MMKDTFISFPRFINLCRKDLVESWKTHILRIVLMYGILVIAFYWNGMIVYYENPLLTVVNDQATDFVYAAFLIFAFSFGCIGASFMMEQMKRKTGCLSVLMTPVTPFEYYFSRWAVYILAFLPVYMIVFVLADFTRVLIFSLILPEPSVVTPFQFSNLIRDMGGATYGSVDQFAMAVSFYLSVQSCFVVGSAVYPKNAFLKTFAVGVVFILFYVICYNVLIEAPGKYFLLGDEVPRGYLTPLLLAFAMFNWTLAYFRFKESEIINRM